MRQISGALIGAVLGMAVGALAGGLWFTLTGAVGLVAGWFFAGRASTPSSAPDDLTPPADAETTEETDDGAEARAEFAKHLAILLFKVARADGEVSAPEIVSADDYFSVRLGFTDDAAVDRAFAYAREHEGSLEAAAAHCREVMQPAERLLLVDALLELAHADGHLSGTENSAIREVARLLEVSDEELGILRRDWVEQDVGAYTLLGISREASNEEIRKSYRQLAARHHPDRVSHLGPGAVKLASERFAELQAAWDKIRRERGM